MVVRVDGPNSYCDEIFELVLRLDEEINVMEEC
jgi:hypothetical protein